LFDTTTSTTVKMKRLSSDFSNLEMILKPENVLERHLIKIPEFRAGLLWGEPRFGHPEGKVIYHIREVLDNIDLLTHLDDEARRRLRLVAYTHDTFKYCEVKSCPRDWSKHHGILARKFLENYCSDTVVLKIIETHDDAYYAWRSSRVDQNGHETAEKTLDKLLVRVADCLQLYYLFFKCDTQTGDKTQASWKWFEKNVSGIEIVKLGEV
jgi:HD domain